MASRKTKPIAVEPFMSGHEPNLVPWWDRDGTAFQVQLHWSEIRGRMEVTSVHISSGATDPKPVGAAIVRRIPLGAMIDTSRRAMSAIAVGTGSARAAELFGARRGIALGHSDLEQVATVYRDAYKRGDMPRRAVAEYFGIAESTAAKRIRAARDLGTLGAALPGVAGEATDSTSR